MNQAMERRLAKSLKTAVAELDRVADKLECDDPDRWTICIVVEGKEQFYAARDDRLTEFANATLLYRQFQLVESIARGLEIALSAANIGLGTQAARVRSGCLAEISSAMGEQTLLVQEAAILKEGERNQNNRTNHLYDHKEIRRLVRQMISEGTSKTDAVRNLAKNSDMPSERQLWKILKKS